MAFVIADRVKERTTTTGTGTVTLTGAATGFQSFSAIGNANTTYYAIVSQTGTEWEVGLGTYTSSGTTLARTTVIASSNAGSAVNFSAGTKDVFVTYPSGRAVLANSSLTSGRVPYATTSGFLTDSANLAFDGTTLTAAGLAGPHNGTVGATTASTGAFTTLTASSTLTATGAGSIQGLTVGRGAGAVASNVAVGFNALAANSTGTDLVAVGQSAMRDNPPGSANTAIGANALRGTTGSQNTALGKNAMYFSSTGTNNTAVGVSALQNTSTGSQNIGIGITAGEGITTGFYNVVIGGYTGSAAPISATGSNFVVLADGLGNVRMYFNGSIAIFNGTISPVQATTAAAPAYVKGAMYFDTTLNKLRIGGATGWETVTSV